MVDVIKLQPSLYNSTLNAQHPQCKSGSRQFNLTGLLARCYAYADNESIKNLQSKQWIDLCPHNPSRWLDSSAAPYSLHRKVMYQELSRPCASTTVRLNGTAKVKPQQSTSYISKNTIGGTVGGIHNTAQASFYNSDIQNGSSFNSLSKFITVKPEPLRPSHNLAKSSPNTVSSWQKYWTSTYGQRRKKAENNADPVLNRKKSERASTDQTQFVVTRDATLNNHEYSINNEIISDVPSSHNISKISTTAVVNKKIYCNEDDINKSMNEVSSLELIGSSLIPPSLEKDSSIYFTKVKATASPIPPPPTPTPSPMIDRINENGKKSGRKDSPVSTLSSSSSRTARTVDFKSVTCIIDEVTEAQGSVVPVQTEVFKIAIIPEKIKLKKQSTRRQRSRSKSTEKKLRRASLISRQKSQIPSNRTMSRQSKASSSAKVTTESKTTCWEKNWERPYTGLRFDPPTPPTSPLPYILAQDSDDEDNRISFEKSELFEHSFLLKYLKMHDL